MKIYKDVILLFWISTIGILSVVMFLHGFFPITYQDGNIATVNDIPKFVENVSINHNDLYKPLVNRIIIMVIDALRWDFIVSPTGKSSMPVTSKLIEDSFACILQAKVEAPTVTMPRIKAITTGVVPTFIDIVKNLGNHSILSDNVLLQAKKHGHKLVFYGDDTWLKLFPTIFDRYDGTTSFFVTDTTEVDDNVTRHINKELHYFDDWSIMILHYLGLDHIGHIHGPFSPLIQPKLNEMDNIIAELYSKVSYWNSVGDSTILIICGDHGMKDSGGHGGATIEETMVPVVTIGTKCSHSHENYRIIAQLDIAATLSVMLGVPIPSSNVGSVALHLLEELSLSQKLFILYYNAKQVHSYFKKHPNYKSQYAHQKYISAVKHHAAWLSANDSSYEIAHDIIRTYYIALNEMKDVLVKNMIKYDFYLMIIAVFYLCQILWIVIHQQHHVKIIFRKYAMFFITTLLLWIAINSFWRAENLFHPSSINSDVFVLFISGVFTVNYCLLPKVEYSTNFIFKFANYELIGWVLFIGTLVHTLSLSSSSFVEEEHQTWYFLWITFCVLLLYKNSIALLKHWPKCIIRSSYCSHIRDYLKLSLILVGHRVLRTLNSIGKKYNDFPDIARWLMNEESKINITLLLVIALGLLLWISFLTEESQYKWYTRSLNAGIAVCIYIRHMNDNTVVKIPVYQLSRTIHAVCLFWVLCAISFILSFYQLILAVTRNKSDFLRRILLMFLQVWVMISALLHQPYNLILLPIQLIISILLRTTLRHNNLEEMYIYISLWLGNVFYFYQGNSNSLADINIAAGYVGLRSYVPVITGIFLIINTYSAPVLAYLLTMYYKSSVHESVFPLCQTLLLDNRLYITWKLVEVIIYTIIVTIQRHHLFIWTVFAPKLLYEAMYFAVMNFIAILIQIMILVQCIIIDYVK